MIKLYPIKIEAYENGEGCFVVEAFDEVCATVTISAPQTPESWQATSKAIKKAIDMMNLGYEGYKQ